jgi:ArsR family transcriptional regulator
MSDLTSPFTGTSLTVADAQPLADVMKALSEPARLQLLNILSDGAEWRGHELLAELGRLTQPTVSHHLAILVDAGLVTSRADGRYTPHCLNRDRFAEVSRLLLPPRGRWGAR